MLNEIKELLSDAPGVVLQDDPSNKFIQCQQMCRKDEYLLEESVKILDEEKGFHIWVVSDNLLKVLHGTQSKLLKAY